MKEALNHSKSQLSEIKEEESDQESDRENFNEFRARLIGSEVQTQLTNQFININQEQQHT